MVTVFVKSDGIDPAQNWINNVSIFPSLDARQKQTGTIVVNDFVCKSRERSGSVVECLTRDRGAAGSSLTGVTVLCP